ncbi:hypothetical protein THRCLA_23041 [Thraustotheca clavata]|uniref:Ankyrin repeat n=1 Tax=Thraustotheca clavata TaxID=74557 RepID=A0A1V9YHZ8_9STRA|nr:hypothetical protein THRCLA_23041 [Thraustotheca clavata]
MKFSSVVMDKAAEYGQLDILKLLHKRQSEGCTLQAVERAAKNGHLEVVKFLHEFWPGALTKQANERAAKNGHLETVESGHLDNEMAEITEQAIEYAELYDRKEIAVLLCQRQRAGNSVTCSQTQKKYSLNDKVDRYLFISFKYVRHGEPTDTIFEWRLQYPSEEDIKKI